MVSASSTFEDASDYRDHDQIQAAALAFAGYDRHHGARQPPSPEDSSPDNDDSFSSSQAPPTPPSLDGVFCTTHRHLHLAVGPDPSTSMTVSFSSEACDDYGHFPPLRAGVMIGTTPHRLDRLVLEEEEEEEEDESSEAFMGAGPRRYNATLKVHKGTELYSSEWQRHITLTGLRPSTTYYYRPVVLRAGGGALAAELRPDLREEQEEDQRSRRRRQLREEVELERLFRLADEMDEVEVSSLRATPDVAPPPAYKSHSYRSLHMRPEQTVAYVETQIAHVEHKIFKGVLESDGAPSFRTAPPANADARLAYHHPTASPIKFAIIGDVAQTRPALDTLSHLNDNCDDISTVLLVGDVAYANGVHQLWDTWFDMLDMYGHTFHHKPLMVAPGNHEVERDSKSNQIFASYESRFRMPQVQPVQGGTKGDELGAMPLYKHSIKKDNIPYPLPYNYGNSFYSFKQGPTHNIILNSFSDFRPGSIQYKWFGEELKSVDRNLTPWLTVTLHCPIYNTFKWHRRDKQSVLGRKYLEKNMYEHDVNFVLSGHLHAYMRTEPVYKGKLDKKGPIHIILGNGGRQANSPYYNKEPEEWIAVRDHTTYGYGTLDFVNATHAQYVWVQTDANDISTAKVKVNEKESTTRAKDRGVKDKVYLKNQFYL